MKTKSILAALWLAAAASVQAAVLTATTAVHVTPSDSSAVITFLKAGSNVTASSEISGNLPAGWIAIEIPSPVEAYVPNKDITKSLDVRPGAALHLQPSQESGVLTTAEAGDKIEINGVRGKWTRLSVSKKLLGYVQVGGGAVVTSSPASAAPAATQAPAPKPAQAPAPKSVPAPVAAAPVQPGVYGVSGTGQPAPMVDLGDGGSATLPRSYEGKFVSSRRPFAPKRPFDYQLNDSAGVRFAYLDLSKLMLTDAIEKYLDRTVAVYGVAKNIPGTRDIVIEVETLQLK